jgi:hypothetical protein
MEELMRPAEQQHAHIAHAWGWDERRSLVMSHRPHFAGLKVQS